MDGSVSSLHASLDALSRFVVGEESLEATLQRVIALAQSAIKGADMVGITMLDERGRLATTVFTDGEAPDIDQAQYRSGAGPCVEAFRTGEVIRIDSTDTDIRWPLFATSATDHGIHSILSLPLVARGSTIGALNVYSRAYAAFDKGVQEIGQLFADQAAVPLANAHRYWETFNLSANLAEAMKSRAVIEQAKGVIAGQLKIDPEDAFTLMRNASQVRNRKLRDIAREVVANLAFEANDDKQR